jgi:TolB-like protein
MLAGILHSQQVKKGSLVILPFYAKGIDRTTVSTAEEILRLEMENISTKNIALANSAMFPNTDSSCTSTDCAAELGKQLKADQVVSVQMLTLGQKLIIQYYLIDVDQKTILLADKLTSTSVEDLDVVMKRMAISITSLESAKKSAQVGAITESESKPFFLRNGRRFNNWSFGYLYPQNGYSTGDKSFTMDVKIGSEVEDMDYGVQLLIREGFGANIFTSYLFSRKDICPYVGAGVGFHWVTIEQTSSFSYYQNQTYTSNQNEKKGDGFEILLNTGVRLFHTYNFRVNVNLTYSYTFNDLKSEAIILTLGFMY